MDYGLQKMAAAQAAKGYSMLGSGEPDSYAGNAIRAESTMERLTTRIGALGDAAAEIGLRLKEHADAVHGSYPEPGNTAQGTPSRCGQLGALEDAIDRLELTLSFVTEQAHRNCALA